MHGTKGTAIMNGEYDKIFFWSTELEERGPNRVKARGGNASFQTLQIPVVAFLKCARFAFTFKAL